MGTPSAGCVAACTSAAKAPTSTLAVLCDGTFFGGRGMDVVNVMGGGTFDGGASEDSVPAYEAGTLARVEHVTPTLGDACAF